MDRNTLAAFLRHVDRTDHCWLWTGPTYPNGYGKFRPGPGQKERPAHRIAYEHWRGPIPDGNQLDHLKDREPFCTSRACVNPAHLEPVTGSENTMRQDHAERRVTHCPKGHRYDETNTVIGKDGKRRCRACRRATPRAGLAAPTPR